MKEMSWEAVLGSSHVEDKEKAEDNINTHLEKQYFMDVD
jgi:hypothetical protein